MPELIATIAQPVPTAVKSPPMYIHIARAKNNLATIIPRGLTKAALRPC